MTDMERLSMPRKSDLVNWIWQMRLCCDINLFFHIILLPCRPFVDALLEHDVCNLGELKARFRHSKYRLG